MNREHTPGPWIVTEGGNIYARRATGVVLPVLSCAASRSVTKTAREANARLIAAAPDMLEALEAVLPWIEAKEGTSDANDLMVDAVRAALTKARGNVASLGAK